MIALIVICIVSLITKTSCQQPTYHLLTPKHGTNGGRSLNSFTCPANGAFIGLAYSLSSGNINSFIFICSSSVGISHSGLFGALGRFEGEVHCAEGEYISSFFGNAGATLTNLGFRCRTINEDLKGDGFIYDAADARTDTPGFNDLAYSNGARPVGVIIYTESDRIVAIQFDYANIPVELCTVNCDAYTEEYSKLHGTTNQFNAKMSMFGCPNGGAIVEIKTMVSGGHVRSLQFGCTSGLGTTQSEVFGEPFGTLDVTTVKCPPGMIVGSIHGFEGQQINALGIRCVVNGETGEYPKFDAQGGTAGTSFDDVQYSNRGLRPVEIQLFYSTYDIYGILVKYANAEVATNCKVNRIDVIDENVQVKSDGFEVLGVATEISCTNRTQLLKLDSVRAIKEQVTIDVSKGGDVTWSTSVSLSAKSGADFFGNKVEVSVDASASVGGSRQWSNFNTNTTSITTGRSAGTEITYKTPGACLIIGYVHRYKIDQDNVHVRYHYKCDTGEMATERATVNLKSTYYGITHFDNYQIRLNDENNCKTEAAACLETLNAEQVAVDDSDLLKQFTGCFKGAGEIH